MKTLVLAAATVALLFSASTHAQTAPAPTAQAPRTPGAPPPSNIKLLTGLSQVELIRDMNYMSASLGVGCDFCHVRSGEHLDFASDAKEEKGSAREMIEMVFAANKSTFNNQTVVSCYTCHRGSTNPVNMIAFPLAPRTPRPELTAGMTPPARPALPTPDEIFSKYVAAIGGPTAASRLRNTHGYSIVGTRFGSDGKSMPVHVDRSLPGQTIVTMDRPDGTRSDQVLTENGGWMRNGTETRDLRPADQERMRDMVRSMDESVLPVTDPTGFRVRRKDKIDDRDVWILDRNLSDSKRQSLYFDAQSGLLLREVIVTDQKIGRIPEQVDFSDYRDVNGVKLPFVAKTTSVDSRGDATRTATSIVFDPTIDPGRFVAPPKSDH